MGNEMMLNVVSDLIKGKSINAITQNKKGRTYIMKDFDVFQILFLHFIYYSGYLSKKIHEYNKNTVI